MVGNFARPLADLSLHVEHGVNQVQIIANTMLKLSRQPFLLSQGETQFFHPLRRRHGFGQHIGKARQETDVLGVVFPRFGAVDLQNAIRRYRRCCCLE